MTVEVTRRAGAKSWATRTHEISINGMSAGFLTEIFGRDEPIWQPTEVGEDHGITYAVVAVDFRNWEQVRRRIRYAAETRGNPACRGCLACEDCAAASRRYAERAA